MKRLMLFVLLLSSLAPAQLAVDLSQVSLSKGDPVGFGSLTSPPVYNTVTSTVFRWNGAAWTGMTGVLLTGDIAALQATGTDPTGRACIGIVPVINTTSKQTFGCIDGLMGPVNVSTASGTGTVTNVVITGTAGQITVVGSCSSSTTLTCTLSIPAVFTLPGTINKLTISQPATGATLTISDGKILAVLNSLTFGGTDSTTINFPNPSAVTNGHCVGWGKSGSTLSLTDVACGGGGGSVGTVGVIQATDGAGGFQISSCTDNGATFSCTNPIQSPSWTGTGIDPHLNFPSNTGHTPATGDIWANAGKFEFYNGSQTVNMAHSVPCDIPIGDTNGSAIVNGQLGPQIALCFIPTAATILEIDVKADAGTPNIIVAREIGGTVTNLLSGALATAASGGRACANVGGTLGIDNATTCSATLQNTTVAAGSYLQLVSGMAGGTAKLFTIHVTYLPN